MPVSVTTPAIVVILPLATTGAGSDPVQAWKKKKLTSIEVAPMADRFERSSHKVSVFIFSEIYIALMTAPLKGYTFIWILI
ncbi:MAG: hypothetical protein C0490_10230 [Marivirga sp.]|nr:hypothetical protein [Marivirga sp.]